MNHTALSNAPLLLPLFPHRLEVGACRLSWTAPAVPPGALVVFKRKLLGFAAGHTPSVSGEVVDLQWKSVAAPWKESHSVVDLHG